jgi:hypothetical protein
MKNILKFESNGRVYYIAPQRANVLVRVGKLLMEFESYREAIRWIEMETNYEIA